jgi:hypothetical protein
MPSYWFDEIDNLNKKMYRSETPSGDYNLSEAASVRLPEILRPWMDAD